jgi:hypothetical protein
VAGVSDDLEGDASAAWTVEAFLTRAMEATGRDTNKTTATLVRWVSELRAYRYQDAQFPTNRFRRLYDLSLEQCPARAAKTTSSAMTPIGLSNDLRPRPNLDDGGAP